MMVVFEAMEADPSLVAVSLMNEMLRYKYPPNFFALDV